MFSSKIGLNIACNVLMKIKQIQYQSKVLTDIFASVLAFIPTGWGILSVSCTTCSI